MNELARQIRTELADDAPEGFAFSERVVRQDEALDRLVAHLENRDPAELEGALSEALREEHQGWAALKLLEVVERLALPGCAEALIALAENPPDEGDRRLFLAGRACEVLLKLPLDRSTRLRADAACKIPLQQTTRFRIGAEREKKLHRPRAAEWGLLVGLMTLALIGLWFAFRA